MTRSRYGMFVVVALFALAACAESVTQIPETKIGMSGNATLEQVTSAIRKAGDRTQWQTEVVQPGVIEAKRVWSGDKHNIVVTVTYNTTAYRIVYKSSKNLKYTGSSIHRSYSLLVGEFNAAIKEETWKL